MIDPPSPLWWLGLIQFITCGLFALLVFVLPKFHHLPSSDRPYMLGIGGFFGVLALIGLVIMSAA